MRLYEIAVEQLDPDVFDEIPPETIAEIAKGAFSKMYPGVELMSENTEEGYVILKTETDNNLYLGIGCSIGNGDISINLTTDDSVLINSGKYKGAITEIIRAVYQYAVNEFGTPKSGHLSLQNDAGFGVWQHIANKLGLEYGAVKVK